MNESKKYKSYVVWPASANLPGNESVDDHDTREAAQAVCDMLRRDGLGGYGKIFPLNAWVEPREQPYDITNNGRLISVIWASTPEKAIELFQVVQKATAKGSHTKLKIGQLKAVARHHDD